MTKIMKKASSILLALAMIITMIPFTAAPAFATDVRQDIKVCINGSEPATTSLKISADYIKNEDNWETPQIFSFLGKKGQHYFYDVVVGPSIQNALLDEAGIKLGDLKDATIAFNDGSSNAETMSNGYNMTVEELMNAKDVVKLVSADGTEIPGNTNFSTWKCGLHVEKIGDVVPVIAAKQKRFNSYAEAQAFLDSWDISSGDAAEVQTTYVGGNISENTVINYPGGQPADTMDGVNWNGKFATGKCNVFSIYIQPTATMSSVKLTTGTEVFSKVPFSAKEKSLLSGLTSYYSNNDKVAKIDIKSGRITPVGNGSCTITIKVKNGSNALTHYDYVAKYTLTVKFNPAKVTKVKVKNIKKKAVKISWKKVSNATGYIVYRRKKGSSKYVPIKATQSTTFVNKKGLKKGKKYFYKVQAFQYVNDKIYYGTKSDTKGLWIKK